jgi:hypothetical protein
MSDVSHGTPLSKIMGYICTLWLICPRKWSVSGLILVWWIICGLFVDVLREQMLCIVSLDGFYWLVICSRKPNQTGDYISCVRLKVLQTMIRLGDGGSHVTVLATYGGILCGQEWDHCQVEIHLGVAITSKLIVPTSGPSRVSFQFNGTKRDKLLHLLFLLLCNSSTDFFVLSPWR